MVLVATRALGKRISRAAGYYLWLLVLLRLVLPWGYPGGGLDLLGESAAETPVVQVITGQVSAQEPAPQNPGESSSQPVQTPAATPADPVLVPAERAVLQALPWVWLAGVVISLGVGVFFLPPLPAEADPDQPGPPARPMNRSSTACGSEWRSPCCATPMCPPPCSSA